MTVKAVILLSGGLDSSVVAYIARHDIGESGDLYALTLSYGQRHEREIESAMDIARAVGACQHIILKGLPIDVLVKTALTGDFEVPTDGVSAEIPSTWVPQRNSIFLGLAFALAETVDARAVYIGVNSVDYSGYPDCRPEFISSAEKTFNLASKRFVEKRRAIELRTPIISKSKRDIVRWGMELRVPFDLTWSCYQGNEKACGVCDSCRIRVAAFRSQGLTDPIEYEEVVK